MDKTRLIFHYDHLIDENNDPVHAPAPLQEYMNKWDGNVFLEALQLASDKSVLKIGVGTGRLALRTAPHCMSFSGIDISPKTIERAKENLSSYHSIHLICEDFLDHEFSEKFDIIYSSLTFMHMEDKLAAVQKAADLLNQDGRLVISIDKNQEEYIDMGRLSASDFSGYS